MEIKTRRIATIIRVGDSSAIVLSSELSNLGLKNGDTVIVSTIDSKIEIEKVKK